MEKKVFKVNEGVKISFSGAVQKQNIVTMVQNCATGGCDCMSESTKTKVQDMQVSGEDGSVEIHLKGDLSVEEIEAALAKSKIINCCE